MKILNNNRRVLTMIKLALIDLSGTLHIETDPTPNAVSALMRLRDGGVQVKFVTNTTKESSSTLYKRLTDIGFDLKKSEIHSSLGAAVEYVKKNKLNPYYLVSDDARTDFPSPSSAESDGVCSFDSVVVGLAPDKFNYEVLNNAFNVLLKNKGQLVAIHEGKYYKRSDGLALGPGCFVKGLEYAANTKAIVIGKPNPYFYHSAMPDGITVNECVMIGDDINDDIAGAMKVGIRGILVKTGKYLPDVTIDPPPTAVTDNFDSAVNLILSMNEKAKE